MHVAFHISIAALLQLMPSHAYHHINLADNNIVDLSSFEIRTELMLCFHFDLLVLQKMGSISGSLRQMMMKILDKGPEN